MLAACVSISRSHLSETEFGLAAVYRIIKKSGANALVTKPQKELRRVVQNLANQIAKSAIELSLHAGRHTVKASDIRLAAKNILGGQ